jgi:hypothetical protein
MADEELADEEVVRLRAEVATLRAEVGRRRRLRSARVRDAIAAVVVAVTALLSVAGVVGLWAGRTVLNTDRWVATVAPLPRDPRVSAAVAQYTVAELSRVLDLEDRVRKALPPIAGFVVDPLAARVRDQLRSAVDEAVRGVRFQAVWVEANRRAHRQALAILEGTSPVVTAQGDRVVVDLLPVVNEAIRLLNARMPTLFGHQITLPDLGSGAVPANLRAIVERALGVSLPADFAQFTIYDAGRLRALQEALLTFKRTLVFLAIGAPLSLVAALLVSTRRRRTALQLGLWLVVAAVAITAILRAARAQLVGQVPAGTYRDGVSAALATVTATLRDRGAQIIVLGAVIAIVAYLSGPGRIPVRLRGWAAAGVRSAGRAVAWIGRHRDPVRVGAVVVAAVAALLFASWTALVVIAVALAAVEIALTASTREP